MAGNAQTLTPFDTSTLRNAPALTLSGTNGDVIFQRLTVVEHASDSYTWIGETSLGDQAHITTKGESAIGTLRTGQDVWRVERNPGAIYPQVLLADFTDAIEETPGPAVDVFANGFEVDLPAKAETGQGCIEGAEGEIGVLVAYTVALDAAVPAQLLDAAITNIFLQGNDALTASSIDQKLYVAGTIKAAYPDVPPANAAARSEATARTVLDLQHSFFFDAVREERDRLGADMVVLITLHGGGKAAAIQATADTAFATVNFRQALDNYSLFHEVGHLLGAGHDRVTIVRQVHPIGTDPASLPGHNFGYVNATKGWHTIVAYPTCAGPVPNFAGCRRIPRISGPTVTFGEETAGVADRVDNRSTILANAGAAACFREARLWRGSYTATQCFAPLSSVPTAECAVNNAELLNQPMIGKFVLARDAQVSNLGLITQFVNNAIEWIEFHTSRPFEPIVGGTFVSQHNSNWRDGGTTVHDVRDLVFEIEEATPATLSGSLVSHFRYPYPSGSQAPEIADGWVVGRWSARRVSGTAPSSVGQPFGAVGCIRYGEEGEPDTYFESLTQVYGVGTMVSPPNGTGRDSCHFITHPFETPESAAARQR